MVTPRDVRLGVRLVPTVGDGYWEKHQNALTVAPMFPQSDPELAAHLLWAAQAGGIKDPTVPAIEPKMPDLKSVSYPGWGAFLRHGFGTEAESYLGIRFRDFTLDHTHNDARAINWYAHGVPLSLDFATMYTPHTPGAWLQSTLTYDHIEHTSPVKCPGRGHPDCFYTGKSWYQIDLRMPSAGSGQTWLLECSLKRYEDDLDLPRAMFWLAHPAALRHFIISAYQLHRTDAIGKRDTIVPEDCVHAPGISSSSDLDGWLKRTLQASGLTIEGEWHASRTQSKVDRADSGREP